MTLPVTIDPALLATSDLENLSNLSEELAHAYATRQIFRTDTEARISVLDHIHHPTKAAKYWQAIREQTTMLEQLALLSFDYRKNEVAIKRHVRNLSTLTDEFDIEEAQIELDECMFKRTNMKSVAADRAREIQMWSTIKSEVNDGSFDINDVNTHQLVSYTTKFALTAATVSPDQMSGDEFANLSGQLHTALMRCKELGVIEDVYANLPGEVTNQLRLEDSR